MRRSSTIWRAVVIGAVVLARARDGHEQARGNPIALAESAAPPPAYLAGYAFDPAVRHDPHLVPSATLQACVEGALRSRHLDARVQAGDLGIAIADLTHTPDAPAFAGLQATRMVYGASVPKIATLAAAFQLRHDVRARHVMLNPTDPRTRALFGTSTADPSRADFTAAYRESLRLMIYRSDNHAATVAVETLGYPYVAAYLWGTGLYDPREGGGLWVGLGFGRGAHSWRPDPLRGLVHAATPLALVRYYALLGQDRLVDATASHEIRTLMGDSAFFNRFRRAALTRYPDAHVFRKTGTVFPWRHDSALIERPGARYAIAGLCRGDDCSDLLVTVGTALDGCVGR